MAYPVTLNGRTYTLADFQGTNYVDGFPDALEDFVTHAGNLYSTTSTTSNSIGTGSKTFTVESSKPYQVGTPLRIADAAAPSTNWIDAIVTAYSGTTLTVDAVAYAGSGTKTSWNINIGGGGTSYTGTLPIAQGGTGATTAAAARTNLDTYSKSEADSRFLNVSGEASDVTMTGNVTIGDAAGDTLTVNATADFNTGFNVDGTITADGLTVDGDSQFGNSGFITFNNSNPDITLKSVGGVSSYGNVILDANGRYGSIQFRTGYDGSAIDNEQRMKIDTNGDISFYEDTGTTPKFFWDASAERLGIGTAVPGSPLEVSNGSENHRVAFGTGEVYLMARNASSYITQEYIANQHVFTGYGDSSSNEAMRITSGGLVGIGTSSPTGDLSISDATYLSSASTVGAKFTLNSENTSSWLGTRELIAFESVGNGADHRTGTLSVKLKKGSSDTTLTEYMQINAVSNYLTFTPNGNERMRINNNTTTLTTNSVEYYATGMQINSTNADFSGALLDMRVTSGAINSTNGRFLRFYGGNGTGERFHVKGSGEIYTAAGIKFDSAGGSGSSTSNTLDSYEEGTWTPFWGGDTTNPTVTYAYRNGYYTKVGRMVHARVYIEITGSVSSYGSGGLYIGGLPFTSANADYVAGTVSYKANFSANQGPTHCLVNPNTTKIPLYYSSTSDPRSTSSRAQTASLSTNCQIYVAVSYNI